VKTGDHVFGECLRHDYSHQLLLVRLPVLFVISTLLLGKGVKFCTASSGTTTPISAMSTSAGLNASGYNLYRLLVVLHIIYIFAYSAKSNMVMNIASSVILLSVS
jgi:hypothetical protein